MAGRKVETCRTSLAGECWSIFQSGVDTAIIQLQLFEFQASINLFCLSHGGSVRLTLPNRTNTDISFTINYEMYLSGAVNVSGMEVTKVSQYAACELQVPHYDH